MARTIEENTASGDVGAAVTATDDDGDTLAYSVAQTSGSDAAAHLTAFNRDFSLNAASGQISVKSSAAIDYETRPSYKVLVQVTDSKNAAGRRGQRDRPHRGAHDHGDQRQRGGHRVCVGDLSRRARS